MLIGPSGRGQVPILPGCWAGKDPSSGGPPSTAASSGVFLTYLSEFRPLLLQKAPQFRGPEPTLGSSGCHSGPFWSHPVYRSSLLPARIATPPTLYGSNSYSFIHSFIQHLLSPLKEAGDKALNETDPSSSACLTSSRKDRRLRALEPGGLGPHHSLSLS